MARRRKGGCGEARTARLIPLLEGLAQATERLRAADWNDDPSTPDNAP